MQRYILRLIGLLVAGFIGYLIGSSHANKVIEGGVEYRLIDDIVIKKDSSTIKPLEVVHPSAYDFRHIDTKLGALRLMRANITALTPSLLDLDVTQFNKEQISDIANVYAAARDWHLERKYSEVLIDSDTLGRAVLNLTITKNAIKDLECTYSPVQKVVTKLVTPKKRLGGYSVFNVTNANTTLAIGGRYGSLGLHVAGGYDYKQAKPIIGAGMLFLF